MQHQLGRPASFNSGNLMVLALGLGLLGGILLDRVAEYGLGSFHSDGNFRLISEAWGLVDRFYVDRSAVKPRPMTYGAISGMVDALGDTGHSRFLSPAMVRQMRNLERGKFQGIGAEIRLREGHVTIVAPMDGSPAQQAGLRSGDIIFRVDGKEVTGLPLDEVAAKISGPAGTSVTLTILEHASGQTREVTLKRAAIQIHNVSWQQLPDTHIAHLRIASIDKGVTTDLREALTAIQSNDVQGIILDLRDNPGGLLSEAVGATSQFLKTGDVVLVKNARGKERAIHVRPGGEATKIPLVVLVNAGTASGAEIMAGALQDSHRAELVGTTTIGTGTVLSEFKLSDGSALLLAVEEWLTPDGHVIWHKGIKPNIEVDLPADVTPMFPAAERGLSAEQFRASHDTQLFRALALLQQQPNSVSGRSSPQFVSR
ncbi:MAG TPA: S41 family peptidase [Verrucomicrobiae bacterium]|nr:S41 family peptidase [Verrucomicrobiae bacterium]